MAQWALVAMQVVGTVMSYMDAKSAGDDALAQGEDDALAYEKDAEHSKIQAQHERAKGSREYARLMGEADEDASAARAALGASGGQVQDAGGSAAQVKHRARGLQNASVAQYDYELAAMDRLRTREQQLIAADNSRRLGQRRHDAADNSAVTGLVTGLTGAAGSASKIKKPSVKSKPLVGRYYPDSKYAISS